MLNLLIFENGPAEPPPLRVRGRVFPLSSPGEAPRGEGLQGLLRLHYQEEGQAEEEEQEQRLCRCGGGEEA